MFSLATVAPYQDARSHRHGMSLIVSEGHVSLAVVSIAMISRATSSDAIECIGTNAGGKFHDHLYRWLKCLM